MIIYILLGVSLGFGILGFALSCIALRILNIHRMIEHKENKNE